MTFLKWGPENYNFFSPYPTEATYQIKLRLAQFSWEEDVIARSTKQDARQTTDDNGRHTIAIGYLSDSCDLKKK